MRKQYKESMCYHNQWVECEPLSVRAPSDGGGGLRPERLEWTGEFEMFRKVRVRQLQLISGLPNDGRGWKQIQVWSLALPTIKIASPASWRHPVSWSE